MKKKPVQEASLSAQTIASLDDLLIEILLRLPMKSLVRFKSVSKHWLSLITDPQFAVRRIPNPNPAIGLFHILRTKSCHDYIPFDVQNPTTPPLRTLIESTENQSGIHILNYQSGIHILNSCNGFLLCSNLVTPESGDNYGLYNPTTQQLRTFPKPPRRGRSHDVFLGVTLVFNPAKSAQYKVVCVRQLGAGDKYQIEIYSSETCTWKASGEPFTEDLDTGFQKGAYWNGRVHWLCGLGKKNSLCFDVDEERLGLMPMPPFPQDWYEWWNISYFDQSCDHLHLIDIYGLQIQFDVYEMKEDYSEWFVKYHVDLAEVATTFPEILRKPSAGDIRCYSFLIYSVTRGEKEEDAFLVLRIPGKAIRYNLVSKTFEKLCHFEDDYMRFYDPKVYQHIESLCCV